MEKLKQLINLKIEEIENYAIDTQENEERYINEIQTLIYAKFLLFGDEQILVDWKKMKKRVDIIWKPVRLII